MMLTAVSILFSITVLAQQQMPTTAQLRQQALKEQSLKQKSLSLKDAPLKEPSKLGLSKRDPVLDEVDSILKKGLKNSETGDRSKLKSGGGGQDGSGGSGEEAEFIFHIRNHIRKMRPNLPVLTKLEYMSAEQAQLFRDTFPKKGLTSQLCVFITAKDETDACPADKKRIYVPISVWKNLNDADKAYRAGLELLGVLGFTAGAERDRAEENILSIINSTPDSIHTFNFNPTNNRNFEAIRDANNTVTYNVSIQPSDKGTQFAVQGPTGLKTYILNAESPFFNLSPCTVENMGDAYIDTLNPEYMYSELKPLAKDCERKVKDGKQIRRIWISEKTKLVFKCE